VETRFGGLDRASGDCERLGSQSFLEFPRRFFDVFWVFLIQNQPFFRGFEAFFFGVFWVISGQDGFFLWFSLHSSESCNECKIGLFDSLGAFFFVVEELLSLVV